jgi:hypothetical protein
MWSTGINALTGIIPACQDHFDSDNFSKVKAPIDHYARLKKGSPTTGRHYPARGPVIPKVGSLIGEPKPAVPSYSGIQNENTIHHPDNYEILITAEIREDLNVYLNGTFIAESPKLKRNAKGKDIQTTQAEKARFCRGVIWWLMNDENCLKDKLSEIGYIFPAPVVIQETDQIEEISIESITGSVYPGAGLIAVPVDHDQEYYNDRMIIVKDLVDEGPEDPQYEGFFKDQNECEVREYLKSIEPAPVDMIRQWSMPQLRITIQECVLA